MRTLCHGKLENGHGKSPKVYEPWLLYTGVSSIKFNLCFSSSDCIFKFNSKWLAEEGWKTRKCKQNH